MTNNHTNNTPPETDSLTLDTLQEMLDAEIQKPYSERNYDLIDELSTAITSKALPEKAFARSLKKGLRRQNRALWKAQWSRENIHLPKLPVHVQPRRLASVCASLLVIVSAFTFAPQAWGSNVRYTVTEENFSFQLSTLTEETHYVQHGVQSDPHGIRAVCEENGFSPLVPQYIPDGFQLTEPEIKRLSKETSASFIFKNKKSHVCLDYDNYFDPDYMNLVQVTVPSDEHNISELEINGTIVIISKEDQQYTANFVVGMTSYSLFIDGISYEEAEAVLRSILE